MASLTESTQWEASIYQIETTDPVIGGDDGLSNRQGKQLANRTAYLKQQVELKAPLASPKFTGAPETTTADADTSSKQIASTEFVIGQAATATPLVDGNAAVGTSKKFARQDHVHPSDTKAAPPGEVAYFAMTTPPTGWLKANGAAVSRTAYAALFAAIGTTYGGGDGATTFNLPDLRGEFLRGYDDGRGVDSSRVFGSAQSGTIQAHRHAIAEGYDRTVASGGSYILDKEQFPILGKGFYSNVPTYTNTDDTTSYHSNTTYYGSSETKPRNVSLLACIKY